MEGIRCSGQALQCGVNSYYGSGSCRTRCGVHGQRVSYALGKTDGGPVRGLSENRRGPSSQWSYHQRMSFHALSQRIRHRSLSKRTASDRYCLVFENLETSPIYGSLIWNYGIGVCQKLESVSPSDSVGHLSAPRFVLFF